MTKLQLTIYLKETEMNGDVPLHEAIVRRLLHFGIAGATVLRGVMGYGRHGHVHRKRLLGVADDQPMVIVAIDEASKLEHYLPEIRKIAPEALFVLQDVRI